MQDSNSTVHHIYIYSQYVSQSGLSDDLRCVEWSIQLLVIWGEDHQASWRVSYMNGKLWYAGCQRNIIYICNLSTSVKAAPSMISSTLNGPFGCLWYDEGTTELLLEYLASMKSYDKQNAISISYIHVTLGCQSRWPLWWSLVHWMDHPTVYDMIRGPPSFFLSILLQWKAVICRNPTVHHIYD